MNLNSKVVTISGLLAALAGGLFMVSQPTYAILNGDPVGMNEHPYFAGVGRYQNDEFSNCGGVLIHPEWVLTAKHCVKPQHTDRSIPIGYYHAAEDGKWKKQWNIRPEIEGHVSFWVPDFTFWPDITVIKLAEPVWGAENRLALATDIPNVGTEVNIIGGGFYKKDNAARDRVRATTTLISYFDHDHPNEVGAGAFMEYGIETGGCLHDSGSPLVFNNKVLGIQSTNSVCTGSSKSYYVTVTDPKHKNWIHCTVPLDPRRTTVVEGKVDLWSMDIPHTQSMWSTVTITADTGEELCQTGLDENGFYRAYLPSRIQTGTYGVDVAVLKKELSKPVVDTDFIKTSNTFQLEKGKINTIQTQTSPNQILKIASTSNGHINNYGAQEPYQSWMPELGEVVQAERWDEGGEGVAYHELDNTRHGHTDYRPDSGVDSKRWVVGWFHRQEWTEYTLSVPKNLQGVSGKMRMKAAAGCGHGKSTAMVIESNASSSPLTMNIPFTGGWSQYKTIDSNTSMSFTGDTAIIRVKNGTSGTGCSGINFDWFQFVPNR